MVRLAGPDDLDRLRRGRGATPTPCWSSPGCRTRRAAAGVALDLALAREARARLAGATMVLAGGLTPETVAAAVALVRPEVVDVSSGVERLPGIKDPDKIARFLEAVRWP